MKKYAEGVPEAARMHKGRVLPAAQDRPAPGGTLPYHLLAPWLNPVNINFLNFLEFLGLRRTGVFSRYFRNPTDNSWRIPNMQNKINNISNAS